MTDIRTTVVVAPREQFSWTRPALEGIFAHTETPHNLVYVDGGSPAPVRRYLALRAHQRREPTELVEYHCKLLRTEVFDKFGMQDPRYLSSGESLDLCLQLREAGYPVYIEPAAVVANQPPPPFRWSDLSFYLLRWSD